MHVARTIENVRKMITNRSGKGHGYHGMGDEHATSVYKLLVLQYSLLTSQRVGMGE